MKAYEAKSDQGNREIAAKIKEELSREGSDYNEVIESFLNSLDSPKNITRLHEQAQEDAEVKDFERAIMQKLDYVIEQNQELIAQNGELKEQNERLNEKTQEMLAQLIRLVEKSVLDNIRSGLEMLARLVAHIEAFETGEEKIAAVVKEHMLEAINYLRQTGEQAQNGIPYELVPENLTTNRDVIAALGKKIDEEMKKLYDYIYEEASSVNKNTANNFDSFTTDVIQPFMDGMTKAFEQTMSVLGNKIYNKHYKTREHITKMAYEPRNTTL